MTPDKRTNFPVNLRYLCETYGSISAVSRDTKINRQQLNKYLSGVSRPSATTLDRLCHFFDVTTAEIMQPPAAFRDLLQDRTKESAVPEHLLKALSGLCMANAAASDSLRGYCGVYYAHFASKNNTGLYRTLVQIYQLDGYTYCREIQVFSGRDQKVGDYPVHKFDGVLFLTGNRLHLLSIEHPETPNATLAMSIFYPSTHPRKELLVGSIVTVSNFWSRRINSSAHILEYAGTAAPTKSQIKNCGYFERDDPAVGALIRHHLFTDEQANLRGTTV